MEYAIHSRRHGTLVFFMPDNGGYVRLKASSRAGKPARQICDGGKFFGSTVSASPQTFRAACRKWYRQRVAILRKFPGADFWE